MAQIKKTHNVPFTKNNCVSMVTAIPQILLRGHRAKVNGRTQTENLAKAGLAVCENVIGRTLFNALDGSFIAQTAGDYDEWYVVGALPLDFQGIDSVPGAEVIVGKDDIVPIF